MEKMNDYQTVKLIEFKKKNLRQERSPLMYDLHVERNQLF